MGVVIGTVASWSCSYRVRLAGDSKLSVGMNVPVSVCQGASRLLLGQ